MLQTIGNWLEKFQRGRTISELARWTGLDQAVLLGHQPKYRQFNLPKKSGSHRLISAPESATKKIQRKLLRTVLKNLRVHDAAVGFIKGKSIVTGACQHTGQAIVLRMDIVDFFQSTQAERVYQYFKRIGWNSRAARALTNLTTFQDGLPQGAPTSPKVSNLVNHGMDRCLSNAISLFDGVYTRYADDITASFSDSRIDLEDVVREVCLVIRSFGYRPHLGRKLSVRRSGQRQMVNGLVVNEKVNLTRQHRRWLRAVKHRAAGCWGWVDPQNKEIRRSYSSQSPGVSQSEFEGWLAYENMIANQRSSNS